MTKRPEPQRIETLDDPRVEVFRNLRDKDLRAGHDSFFMAESEMVLRQVLRSPSKNRIHSVLVTQPRLEKLKDALAQLPPDVPVYVADKPVVREILGIHLHRGALAAVHRPPPETLTLDGALGFLKDRSRFTLVITEGVNDTDNMGSIFRNTAAFGADAVVLDPTSCDPLYRKSVRTSVGHVLNIPFARSENFAEDLMRLKTEWGLTLVGAETELGARPVWEAPQAHRLGIILGSEGYGLSPETVACCDAICEIPMAAEARSLNVAAATAVMLYELVGRNSESTGEETPS
jgi:tRNA G18 (ribose-2'-O)-methylase SpoU